MLQSSSWLTREATLEQLMRYVPGPDWPTGGTIIGRDGIREAYATGRDTLTTRAATHIEHVTARKQAIVVTELPYMVGPEKVIERISDGVKTASWRISPARST